MLKGFLLLNGVFSCALVGGKRRELRLEQQKPFPSKKNVLIAVSCKYLAYWEAPTLTV